MKLNQSLGIFTIALSSLFVYVGKASAIVYSFSNVIPNPADPLSMSGFFDIDDSLGSNPGIVEFGTELTDYSLEISSNTTGVPSTTLVPGNSSTSSSNIAGVTVNSSQLDFSGVSGGGMCISNNGCLTSTTPGEAVFSLSLTSFLLELGAEPNSNFQNGGFAGGSFANFPQQINNSAAVPFEFSPTLGLIVAGSLFGVARYRNCKNRQVKL